MNNEYIIVNKTLLVDKIRELKEEREGHEKVDIGMFDAIWAAKTSQAIDLLEEIISLSLPLIPEIEKAFKAAKIPYKVNDEGIFGYENAEHYIENLKLDI